MTVSKNTAPRDYSAFSTHVQYGLHELSYFAQATQAMLELFDNQDWSMDDKDRLTGVSYMLTRIHREAQTLVEEMDNTERAYQLKPASTARETAQ